MSLKRTALGLAAVGISSAAMAQPPTDLSIPNGPGSFPGFSAPLPAQPGALGIAPRPAMPTQNTLASFMGVSADQREYRQRAQADTPFGALRSRVQGPMSTMTGGLIKPFPAKTPSLAELQSPGAVGAASQVKLDRANAEKRMAAVQYLGTVDCHYWPEAEGALIDSLRGDRNECVRLAAANVLLNGCCCTKKVIKALSESAAGTNCDGFPSETSCRVRAAAQAALEKCLLCFCDMEAKCEKDCDKKPAPLPPLDPVPPPRPSGEKIEDPKKKPGEKTMAEPFYERVARLPSSSVIADARKVLSLSIPMEDSSPSINQLDLMAAGEAGPDAASARSPRPTSLINWFATKPATPGVTPIAARPMGSNAMVVHHSVPVPVSTPVAAPVAASIPAPAPILVAAPVAASVPAPVASPITASASTEPAVSKGQYVPTKVMSASMSTPKLSRADQVSRMMKSLVPMSELTVAINQLTAEDLSASPGVASELIAVGARSTNLPLRLATIQALVRCQVATMEAQNALRVAAQSDPEMSVRAAALAGLPR